MATTTPKEQLEKEQPQDKRHTRTPRMPRTREDRHDAKHARLRRADPRRPDRTGRRQQRDERQSQPVRRARRSDPSHDAGALRQHSIERPGRRKAPRGQLLGDAWLETLFVFSGFAIALTMVTVFGCDLIAGWPFQRASVLFDATSVVCGFGLAVLAWEACRDLQRERPRKLAR